MDDGVTLEFARLSDVESKRRDFWEMASQWIERKEVDANFVMVSSILDMLLCTQVIMALELEAINNNLEALRQQPPKYYSYFGGNRP